MSYTGWLMNGQDLTQHYLGWVAYRQGAWRFPLGLCDVLSYPTATSVIFTDSLPWLAVFFKLFRGVLPESFQYFGLWGLGCFMLQGVYAVKLLRRVTTRWALLLPASLFFVTMPVMVGRMYGHTALAGQWILLAAMDAALFVGEGTPTRRQLRRWAGLGALCAGVHMYFVAMAGLILCGACLMDVLRRRRLGRSAVLLGGYVAAAALGVWVLGGFAGGVSASPGGLGIYSFNLAAFFNPMGWSRLLEELPAYGTGQYEGFAYLGMGVILLALTGLVLMVALGEGGREKRPLLWAVAAVFVVSIVLAASPDVTLLGRKLFTWPLPGKLRSLWGVFRATGRFAWTPVYLLTLWALALVFRHAPYKAALVIALLTLGVQLYDIQDGLAVSHRQFDCVVSYENPLEDEPFWESLGADESVEHLYFHDSFLTLPTARAYALADWAVSHGKTLNTFYFARSNTEAAWESFRSAAERRDPSSLFLFRAENSLGCGGYPLHYYALADGLLAGCAVPRAGQESVSAAEIMAPERTVPLENGVFLSDGEDKDGERVLWPGGLSFGPYWAASAGTYRVTIRGAGLTEAAVAAYSAYGADVHPISVRQREDDCVVYELALPYNVDALELTVGNPGAAPLTLRSITLLYLHE